MDEGFSQDVIPERSYLPHHGWYQSMSNVKYIQCPRAGIAVPSALPH